MATVEGMKAHLAEAQNALRPLEVELGQLRLTIYPEQGIVVLIGIQKHDEKRQPTISEVGKVIALLTQKGYDVEKIFSYPIAGNKDNLGVILTYK